ncbi:hypothetical protein HHI36_015740 [Cryptolaemus montrouzieri]|uniref:Uncharacterized protein n=1 Tax=Cryptolaemus montrouzieri TaxID=559131 RepID=A0ABD2N710_9CUCU
MTVRNLGKHCIAIVCFERFKTNLMKGVIAILGLVACATAFQYYAPQNGRLQYGRQHQVFGDSLLSDVYNRFQGPYHNQLYQRRYRNQYQGNNVEDNQRDTRFYDSYYQDANDFYRRVFGEQTENQDKKYRSRYEVEDTTVYQGKNQEVEGQYQEHVKTNDKELLQKQKHVYQLLRFINNPIYDAEYERVNKDFDLEQYAKYYQPEAYKNFTYLWENQVFLPKGEIFSVFNDIHVTQVKALFKLFYTAKNYEIFHKTAIWARQHINEGMFLYTYSVAISHRPDTQEIILPAIYELYPQYFFSSEVMQKAYQYKMSHYNGEQRGQRGVYTIRSNYTGHYLNLNPEQSLAYYLEDVGISSVYYYINLHFPYWMDAEDMELNLKRGEIFYCMHQQLLARYYLERLSHGVGGIEYFNWDVPFETGYYPSLTYPNGLAFSERPNFANLQEYFSNYGQRWCFISKYGYGYTYVNTYEQRIREAIDLGYAYSTDGKKVDLYTPEGLNILANIVEGNTESTHPRYYGSYNNYARHLLGYSKQPLDNNKVAPSALEHFETSLRDPAFYNFFKKVTVLFNDYLTKLPAYTKKDLTYPGVKIEKFEVDPLVTFYDKFYADITNGLSVTPEEYQRDSDFRVQVEQYRLNNKNFNYRLYINSEKDTKATVKVFLGPKYDEHGRTIDLNENRVNFIELDHFVYDLKSGQNKIVRNSREFFWYIPDKTTYMDMYRKIMTSNDQEYTFPIDEVIYGFPQRYMLPRGSEGGLTFQMYVILYPYVTLTPQEVQTTQNKYSDYIDQKMTNLKSPETNELNNKVTQFWMVKRHRYSMNWPFDRAGEFENVFSVPNAYMKDVKIYHKVLRTDDTTSDDYIN